MDLYPDVTIVSHSLATAIETSFDPQTDPAQRQQACQFCEDFKQTNPLRLPCALHLTKHEFSPIVRHFGLQMLEHIIKHEWRALNLEKKFSIRNTTLQLLKSVPPDFEDLPHLHNALAKVLVELVKCDLLHDWNVMLTMMKAVTSDLTASTIVLLVFLRCIEDVVLLDTTDAPESKFLYSNFSQHADDIMALAVNLMVLHSKQDTFKSRRMIVVGVNLCSQIIESFVWRFFPDERLVPALCDLLCTLLTHPHFTDVVIDCFSRFANKRGHPNERLCAVTALLNAGVLQAISQMNVWNIDHQDEPSYEMVKKVVELLCDIAKTACVTTALDAENLVDHKNFRLLIEMLFSLSSHHSLIIGFCVNSAWLAIFKHSVIGPKVVRMGYGEMWVSSIFQMLLKPSYSREEIAFEPRHRYLIIDFEDGESCFDFFISYRNVLVKSIQMLTTLEPKLTFIALINWASKAVHQSENSSIENFAEYLYWEALAAVVGDVLHRMPVDEFQVNICSKLLDRSLELKICNLKVESFRLTFITACMVYVSNTQSAKLQPAISRAILEKLLSGLTYTFPNDVTREQHFLAKSLQQHAGSLLIKLAKHHNALCRPFFCEMCVVLNRMVENFKKVGHQPVLHLLETLMLLNDQIDGYERKVLFIYKTLSNLQTFFNRLNQTVDSVEQVISFVGLDVPMSVDEGEDENKNNKRELLYSLKVIEIVLRCTTCRLEVNTPEIWGKLAILGYKEDGTPVIQNPAAQHVIPFVVTVFKLVRVFNMLFSDKYQNLTDPEMRNINSLSETEKMILNGKHLTRKAALPIDEIPVKSLHQFFTTLYDACFTILANACKCLHYSFYSVPNFAPSFKLCIFPFLDFVPDYRLHCVLKGFFRSVVVNCPETLFEECLIPILSVYTTYMCKRLFEQWLAVDDIEDDEKHFKQILFLKLCQDHDEIVNAILFYPKTNVVSEDSAKKKNSMFISNTRAVLTKLGVLCLRNEAVRCGIMEFIMECICCPIMSISMRNVMKIPPIVEQLLEDKIMNSELAVAITKKLLESVDIHEKQGSLVGPKFLCIIQVYVVLRPMYPELYELLTSIPGINMIDLQNFDEKAVKNNGKKITKGLKDPFRNVMNPVVDRIAEAFPRKESIQDLRWKNILGIENLIESTASLQIYD